jgi:hypothetical protein
VKNIPNLPAPRRPKIEFYDSPYRLLVPSFNEPGVRYLVDLKEHGGNGRCSCPDFQFRLAGEMPPEGGAPARGPMRCKHIRMARDFVLTQIMLRLDVRDTIETQS